MGSFSRAQFAIFQCHNTGPRAVSSPCSLASCSPFVPSLVARCWCHSPVRLSLACRFLPPPILGRFQCSSKSQPRQSFVTMPRSSRASGQWSRPGARSLPRHSSSFAQSLSFIHPSMARAAGLCSFPVPRRFRKSHSKCCFSIRKESRSWQKVIGNPQ